MYSLDYNKVFITVPQKVNLMTKEELAKAMFELAKDNDKGSIIEFDSYKTFYEREK